NSDRKSRHHSQFTHFWREISQVLLGRKRERSTKIAPSAVNSNKPDTVNAASIVRRQKAAIRNISKSPLLLSSQSCEASATQLPGITRAVLRAPLYLRPFDSANAGHANVEQLPKLDQPRRYCRTDRRI